MTLDTMLILAVAFLLCALLVYARHTGDF